MRLRRIAGVVATALTATVMLAAPASAGTGESGYCFDGGWTDIPLVQTPITLGVEVRADLVQPHVALCYATSPVGSGAAHTTGGLLKIAIRPDGTGFIECRPDANPYVLLVDCDGTYDFNALSNSSVSVFLNTTTVDTNVTSPVTLQKTGVEFNPGVLLPGVIGVDPLYPCIWINGVQVVPGCNTQIF